MARTSYSRERITITRPHAPPPFPVLQLNIFLLTLLTTGSLLLGVFADLMAIQNQFGLGIPWLFPYGVTVGSLTVAFVLLVAALRAQGVLEPRVVGLGCAVLGVLFLTGVVETGVQLFGAGKVSTTCTTYISSPSSSTASHGISIDTLAWLEQYAICNEWDAAFAFWIVGLVFVIWMGVVSAQVAGMRRRGW